jgi:prepilin signal peptidase PulO-like enzyme (type II secretory pathway)
MFFNLYFFILGAAGGSFAALMIDRIPNLESIVYPGSYCSFCQRPLLWIEKFPIVSFALLRGKSRCCQRPIPPRLFLIEIVSGLLAMALWQTLGLTPSLFMWIIISPLLLTLLYLDLLYFWLPDRLTNSLIGIIVLFHIWTRAFSWEQLFFSLAPFAMVMLLLALFYVFRKQEVMGRGDVKLILAIGLLLQKECLIALVLASIQGGLFGLAMLCFKKTYPFRVPLALADDPWQPPKGAIPFGPFLILAVFETLFIQHLLVVPLPH